MRAERRKFLFGLAGLAMSGAAPGPVTCRVVDRVSGQTLAARLRLLRRGGVPVVPLGHPVALSEKKHEGDVRFQSQRFAYTDCFISMAFSTKVQTEGIVRTSTKIQGGQLSTLASP